MSDYIKEKVELDKKTYLSIHYWLRTKYGRPQYCESPNCTGRGKRIEWALKKGKQYDYNRENFWWLCKSCHSIYDFTESGKRKISLIQKGHTLSPEARKRISEAGKKRDFSYRMKKVYIYKDKKLVKVTKSLKEAAEFMHVTGGGISMLCTRKLSHWTLNGYSVSYESLY